jgi:predicted enzyme related to lactoylglutathione lyase
MYQIALAQLWVHDQDAALDFYTQKLGMEVRNDVTVAEMGNFRWLVVGPPQQPEMGIALVAIPGPPVMDTATAAQVADVMAKGYSGTVFLTTEDCQGTYEELSGRGVEFSETPQEMPYGIDAGFHDPSGNRIRLTQVKWAEHLVS